MDRAIRVSLPNYKIEVSEDGVIKKTITKFAFGRDGHHTPVFSNGALSMAKRDRDHHSTIYNAASMPFALFFEQDSACAFHQGDVAKESHGCIHLSETDAHWLFDWAAHFPVKLDILGPYPAVHVAPDSVAKPDQPKSPGTT